MAADKLRLRELLGYLSKSAMLALEDAITVHLALPRGTFTMGRIELDRHLDWNQALVVEDVREVAGYEKAES